MRQGRAVRIAGAIALSSLAIRCTSFGSSPAGPDAGVGDGGAGAIVGVPNDGGTCERPAGAPLGAVVWPANCHAYLFVHSPLISWVQADDAARSLGGHLVTVTSAEENAFVFELLKRELDAAYYDPSGDASLGLWFGPWLGAVRDAQSTDWRLGWAWTTGEPFAYTAWSVGEPNSAPDSGESRLCYFARSTFPPASGVWADIAPAGYGIPGYVVEFE
jgi:hypothetical protein